MGRRCHETQPGIFPKSYPAVGCNDAIDLTVMPEEIHSFFGENGARG